MALSNQPYVDADIKPNVAFKNLNVLSGHQLMMKSELWEKYDDEGNGRTLAHPKSEKVPVCSSPIIEPIPDVDDVLIGGPNTVLSPAETVIICDTAQNTPLKGDFPFPHDDSFFHKVPSNISLLRCESVEEFLKLNDSSLQAASFSSFIDQANHLINEGLHSEEPLTDQQGETPSSSQIERQDTVLIVSDSHSSPQKHASLNLTPSLLQILSSICKTMEVTSRESQNEEQNTCTLSSVEFNDSIIPSAVTHFPIQTDKSGPSHTPLTKPLNHTSESREALLERLRKRCAEKSNSNLNKQVLHPFSPKQGRMVTEILEEDEEDDEDSKNDSTNNMSFRERNRIAARKARDKKKRYVEELEHENLVLKRKLAKWKVQMQVLKRDDQDSRNLITELLKILSSRGLASLTHCKHCGMPMASNDVRTDTVTPSDAPKLLIDMDSSSNTFTQESPMNDTNSNTILSPIDVNKRVAAWGRLFGKETSLSKGTANTVKINGNQQVRVVHKPHTPKQPLPRQQVPQIQSGSAPRPRYIVIRPANQRPQIPLSHPRNKMTNPLPISSSSIPFRPNLLSSSGLAIPNFSPNNFS